MLRVPLTFMLAIWQSGSDAALVAVPHTYTHPHTHILCFCNRILICHVGWDVFSPMYAPRQQQQSVASLQALQATVVVTIFVDVLLSSILESLSFHSLTLSLSLYSTRMSLASADMECCCC